MQSALGRLQTAGLGLVLLMLLIGCVSPGRTGREDTSSGAAPPTGQRIGAPKRMAIAIKEAIPGMSDKIRTGPGGGTWIVEEMVNAGLVIIDGNNQLQPQLAEQVPTLENGLWKLNADGTMEITWKLRPNAKWHDGTPFTTADLLFTWELERNPQVPLNHSLGSSSVASVEALDAQTIVVTWSRPYIDADLLFSRRFAIPVAKHKLEATYQENWSVIHQHPYWTTDFVGTGPFKVREFVQGSHLLLLANEDYVLGRPRLDELEVRFISDGNTLVANVLAGQVDGYVGPGLTLDQGVQVRDQWRSGTMELAPANWVVIHPQFINANPPIVTNLQFRRALLHALDRQQMVDSLQFGLTEVAHSFLQPNQPQYREIEAQVMRYEYDPRRAEQMITELGYTRRPDGFFVDSTGQRLSVELRTTAQNDIQPAAQAIVADAWKRLGVDVETVMIPVQAQRDPAYRATFPAFELLNGPPNGEEGLAGLHGSRARLPENNFIGSNYPRYQNPEFDALLDRYFVTIPLQERIQVLGQIIRHISVNLNEMGLFHTARPVLVANRTLGFGSVPSPRSTEAWNVHLWDVR